jgi:phosphatidylglycerophosphatase A
MTNPSPFASKRGQSFKVRSAMDWLAIFLATGFGVGVIPYGPGTFGSAVGLLIAVGLISTFSLDVVVLQNALILASLLLAGVGIWASARAERCFERKDAGQIVIDEVCGQVMSFVFIAPYLARLGPAWRWWMLVGFALFRVFDMFKPYPINRLQDLEGGFGVMMDDVVAGLYTAALLSLVLFWVL